MDLTNGLNDLATEFEGGCTRLNKSAVREFQNYQSNGFVTSNEINHRFIPKPALNEHPVDNTLAWPKHHVLMEDNPFVLHDQFVTTNDVFHGRKFYNQTRDYQPTYPQAPAAANVHHIKGDWHRYMEGWINGKRVNRGVVKPYNTHPFLISETKEKFPAKCVESSYLYGTPQVHIPPREIFTRAIRLFHPTYDEDDYHHPMFRANPYTTTNQIVHRKFEKDLVRQEQLEQIERSVNNGKSNDVAIKMRVRPMQDPFESTLTKKVQGPVEIFVKLRRDRQPSVDTEKYSKRKLFFNKSIYGGCPPRVFQPPNFLCNQSTYQGSYSKPNHSLNVLNHSKFLQADYYIPTKISAPGVMKTPAMYVSENTVYGTPDKFSRFC